jgi:hypothetical protein
MRLSHCVDSVSVSDWDFCLVLGHFLSKPTEMQYFKGQKTVDQILTYDVHSRSRLSE